jgi:5'-nucleotidase
MKKRIYVDMDGVLCDFYGAFKRDYTPENPYPHSQYGFFLNLEPIPGAIYSMKRLMQDFDTRILTRPSVRNVLCYTEKAVWTQNYLGFEMLDNLILACDKSQFTGAYLIDDQTENGQTEFNGKHIHFGSEEFPDWATILKYIYDNEQIERN